MVLRKHSTYKNSNIPWLGKIPEHWDISKVKHILSHKKKTLNPGLDCGSISFGNVIYKDNDRVPIETKATYQELLNGEFLINPLNLNFDLKSLRTGLSTINVVVSTGYIVLQTNEKFNKRYLKWLLHQFDISYMKTLGSGVRQTLSYTDIKNCYFPNISKSEQTAIANFLDYKLEKIDRFITKKKQLIELLNEQKAAIINQAVTKGLNPNAKMKPSGIEWLGDIPEQWKTNKIKWLTPVRRGASPRPIDDPKYFDENGEYAWVRIADVTASNRYLENTKQQLSELGASLSVKREPGDIFLSIAGSVGKPIITKIKCCIHDGFVWFANLNINKEYLFYIFKGGQAYKGLGKMGTQLNLNTETVGSIKIPLPSEEEIETIVIYLDKELNKIDKTISTIEEEIALVEEYKTALIAEAVTGKIDVRNFEIPLNK